MKLSTYARRLVIRFGGGTGAFCKVNEWQEAGSVNATLNDRNWVVWTNPTIISLMSIHR
ncbi:hypothetical protein [Sphingomonas parapaucimobilis]|uniref:hypothetical protein n=1 Tax=Sphingomonas parapaucimobilis TaxID=28213 RepID=UPI0035C7D11D